jgi:hypothetical protein
MQHTGFTSLTDIIRKRQTSTPMSFNLYESWYRNCLPCILTNYRQQCSLGCVSWIPEFRTAHHLMETAAIFAFFFQFHIHCLCCHSGMHRQIERRVLQTGHDPMQHSIRQGLYVSALAYQVAHRDNPHDFLLFDQYFRFP